MPKMYDPIGQVVDLTLEESLNIKEFRDWLAACGPNVRPVLTMPSGERARVPEALLRLLREAAAVMALGPRRVLILTEGEELTTNQAAGVLGISRPHLIQLLDRGQIPYHWVGSHRRIPIEGLLVYKQTEEARSEKALQELVDLSEDLGLYDAGEPREEEIS